MSFIEVYTEIRINSKLAEEKYFLDDRQISMLIITRCTRGDARSFFCTYKTYLYAQNYFRKNKFKYCFKSYIKLHEYANCNSANYDV